MQIALATPGLGAAPKTVDAKPAKPSTSSREMTQRAKAAVMSIGHEKPSMVEKLWGKDVANGPLLAYASADAKIDITGSLKEQNPMLGGAPPYDKSTAVYVISSKTVYLPDGTQLEAHSGLGSKMDDPKYSHVRMQGVTPPHIYDLKPREALFHGVPALRLNPIGGEEKIFGRDGILAHTLHARRQRPVQWLRVVQGLLCLPRCLQEQGHPPACGDREAGLRGGALRPPVSDSIVKQPETAAP